MPEESKGSRWGVTASHGDASGNSVSRRSAITMPQLGGGRFFALMILQRGG